MSHKILCIDKNPQVREALDKIISLFGMESIGAETVDKGLGLINNEIDLVIIEPNFPGQNGLELLEKIRQKYPVTPICVLTDINYFFKNIIHKPGLIDEFIAKPIEDLDMFDFRLQNVIRRTIFSRKNNIILQESANIKREIIFAPEYKQAGISILSYFSEVVAKKYPGTDIKIKIEQQGNNVTLIIENNDGELERIVKTFELYGLVISGKASQDQLFDNSKDILELNQKLQIAALELRMTKQLHNEFENINQARICSLEEEIKSLRIIVGKSLAINDDLIKIENVIYTLISENINDNIAADSLKTLLNALTKELDVKNKLIVEQSLVSLQKNNKNTFDKLTEFMFLTFSGASGSALGTWIVGIINSLPK